MKSAANAKTIFARFADRLTRCCIGVAFVTACTSDPARAERLGPPDFDEVGIYKGDPGEPFIHNGSRVRVYEKAGLIVYQQPRRSIADAIKSGDVLFRGQITERGIVGTAYVFKTGCEPIPYTVSGDGYNLVHFVLRGTAPVRDKNSYAVVGASSASKNSTLSFEAAAGYGE